MSDQSKPRKSLFEIIQSVFMLITPILVAFLGYFFNNKVDEIQNKIAPVEAMLPFMKMMTDTSDVSQNIMGAYGIYMLKEGEDSKIAARMIAATQKSHLADVLRDIGKDDDSVQKVLNDLLDNPLGITPEEYSSLDDSIRNSLGLTPLQIYALNIKHDIDLSNLRQDATEETTASKEENVRKEESSEVAKTNYSADGWIYLGNINTGLIVNKPDQNSIKSDIYKLKKATNLRTGKPEKSNGYKIQRFLRTLKEGSEVKILKLDIDKKGHFWVEVDEL
jgi:hypothetical protein